MNLKKLLIAAITGALLISGCSTGSKTAIKVGDVNITDQAIKFTTEHLIGTSDTSIAVEALQTSYLTKEIADKMEISLDESEEKAIQKQVSSFKANEGGKSAGDKLLKKYGLDDDILETILASSIYSQKIFEQINIEDATDEELREYFKNDYLRAKHVLISTQDPLSGADVDADKLAEAEAKANEVLEKAKSGENFDELIKEYGEDPGMESNTDGYFFTDNEMVPEFEEATKSIQPGEFTLCKSSFGYHIIQRLPIDETDESFEKFFTENNVAIKSRNAAKKQEEALNKKAEELGIKVEVEQDVIDSIVIETPAPAEAE
ncbi:MAG: peptidylprolyl isomerase [Clostridia bacterium]|nr:peptidylprolyl isomerase [Clostridia bacterium]